MTTATNLDTSVPDSANTRDVFFRDLQLGITKRISVGVDEHSQPVNSDGDSYNALIDLDGAFA